MALAQRRFHGCDQLARFIGLFHEVESPAMQRMFRTAEARVSADDDDLAIELLLGHIVEYVVTVDPGLRKLVTIATRSHQDLGVVEA